MTEFFGINNVNSVGALMSKDQTLPFFETSDYVSYLIEIVDAPKVSISKE